MAKLNLRKWMPAVIFVLMLLCAACAGYDAKQVKWVGFVTQPRFRRGRVTSQNN